MVFDGWSAGVLLGGLSELYGRRVRGESGGLPELELQYADYAVWQRERLVGEVREGELGYWRERLGGGEVREVAGDRARGAGRGADGGLEGAEMGGGWGRGPRGQAG